MVVAAGVEVVAQVDAVIQACVTTPSEHAAICRSGCRIQNLWLQDRDITTMPSHKHHSLSLLASESQPSSGRHDSEMRRRAR